MRNKQSILKLYNDVLPKLAQRINDNIGPVKNLFDNFGIELLIDTWTKDPTADVEQEISVENGNVQQLGIRLRLEGFTRPGAGAFDLVKDLIFKLDHYSYTVGPDKNNAWLEKEYLQYWEADEYDLVAERWSEELIDTLTEKIQGLAQ